jgi:X-X-X-Leu-X-X-Gly heptad repeat protein
LKTNTSPVWRPENGPNAYFNPNAYPLYVDGIAAVGADGTYWDCYYNYYRGSASFNSLSTLNTGVATANSGTSELQGVGAGDTDVVAEYQFVY